MTTGRVCSIHGEYCPDGKCRWCEPLPEPTIALHMADWGGARWIAGVSDHGPAPFDLGAAVERVQRQFEARCRCGHTPLKDGQPVVFRPPDGSRGYVRHSKTGCETVTLKAGVPESQTIRVGPPGDEG